MKNALKRTTAGLLVLIQLLLLAACSKNTPETQEKQETASADPSVATDTAETAETEPGPIYTGLEELNLDGYDFRILANSEAQEHCHHDDSLAVEEIHG